LQTLKECVHENIWTEVKRSNKVHKTSLGRWDGRACSTYGRDEKCIQDFGWKIWREETTR